jgi:transposase
LILSRKQKEALVIKLANEGKTTREIAQIAHVSLKVIGSIIRKFTGDDKKQEHNEILTKKLSRDSKCLQMFKEGYNNVDVAITLDMPGDDVMANYMDYQRLQELDDFIQLYRDLGYDRPLFILLYKRMKAEGLLTQKEILNLIRVESELKVLASEIDKECQEIGRLNLIKLQLIDQIKAMGGFA